MTSPWKSFFQDAKRITISYLQNAPLGIAGEIPVCSLCGEQTDVGGLWVGREPIVVCSHACAKKVILLALDTISSADGSISYAEWMRLADKSYDRWEGYHIHQMKKIAKIPEMCGAECPVCQR